MRLLNRGVWIPLLAGALLAAPAAATTVRQMDLGQLLDRADRVFRGTVVDVVPGTLSVGGGELPIVTYYLEIEESFKGSADIVKGDTAIALLRMAGGIKPALAGEGLQKFPIFTDLPRLEMGSDYLLVTTAPSAGGLSTTVGLGQGAFTVFTRDKEDFAVNQFNNMGLGLESDGPVPYVDLAAKIQALLGQ